MSVDVDRLMRVVERLEAARIHYSLSNHRSKAISVLVAVPGERWERDFLDDGSLDVEIFRSDGTIYDEVGLEDLFLRFSD